MSLFNKVGIVGTGLIGGSIGLAIKKHRLAGQVIGVSRHKKSILLARKIGAIDRGSQDINIIKGADLVILAAPVNTIINIAEAVAKITDNECIVTDVGSTKEQIVGKLEKTFPNFIGGHPLAGSEKRGAINANPGMFKGSLCLLTPTKDTNRRALNKLRLFWQKIGAKAVLVNPKLHDKILSFVSHLPHIAAFSLIGIIPRQYLKFSSNGLKDTTRIASSESQLWVDILLSNRKNMLKAITLWQDNISGIKSAIEKKDRGSLSRLLRKAKTKRDKLV